MIVPDHTSIELPSSGHSGSIPASTKQYILHTLHRARQPEWSTEWLTKVTLHNLGNVTAALFCIAEELQSSLTLDQVIHLHTAFTYLYNTIQTSQQLFRSSQIRPTRFHLSSTLSETCALFTQEYKQKKISFTTYIPKNVLAYGHPNITQQIVVNILRNSIDALANSPQRNKNIRVNLSRRPKSLQLVVEDNGPGVAPELLPVISKPAYTTKPLGQGLGLAFVDWHMRHTVHGTVTRCHNPPHGLRTILVFPLPPDIDTIAP
ncbi:HAMP domain-containing histidine kinase [Candidatus Woesebacteria bacterium]|nr:HAMP domain-containing histidine kinase [Candidatus Woesebacteria bacterium]MCD8507166.1 HAMP domain-containing histidine kinase [Candidatus Woesebacteria bacterium]MCD8527057.1 HAMP domain-containing histidine kinase [Candidatus Woesebacteria bacterium]MCD8545942.1 HAMP domain-containing histidine kinase [Candidatus Woesebacteria bacterium]